MSDPERSVQAGVVETLPIDDLLSLDRLCWSWRSGSDVSECLNVAFEKAIRLSGSSCGVVFTFDGQDPPQPSIVVGVESDWLRDPQIKAASSLVRQNGSVTLIAPSSSMSAGLRKAGAKAALGAIIRVNSAPVGLMVLGGESYSDDQIAAVASVAHYTSMAIERAMACKEAEERLSFFEAVSDISAALVSERDLKATLAIVVERAAKLIDAESTAVGLLEDDGKALRCLCAYGPLSDTMQGMSFDTSLWPLSSVIESKQAQSLDNPSNNPDIRPTSVREWGVGSALLAPLKLKDTVIGTLAAGNKVSGGSFTQADLKMFETLSNYAAIAISNSRLFDSAQQSLTGLEAERTKLEGILDNLADGVLVCDANQRITMVNRAAEEILEVQADKLVGQDLVATHPAEHRIAVRRMLQAMTNGSAESPLHELKIEYGKKVLRISASPVTAKGECWGHAMVLQDITSIEEVGQAKSDFISTVAHELKTPLTSLKGSVRLMMGSAAGTEDRQFRELLDIADNNCNRLTRLVDDMMDIAKIEAGRLGLLIDIMSVYDAAVGAVKAVQQIAADKSVSLAVRLVGSPPLVPADRGRIEQVIINLLTNAIRYSPENGEVIVSVRHIHGYVRVSVQDFGQGIPRKDMGRVFEKFYQVGGPAARRDGGSGLGLAISKAIVEQHGGKMYVRSTVGHGSSFVFTIPIQSRGKVGEPLYGGS